MNKAYYITAGELAKTIEEKKPLPTELQSSKHLIYSSPATLSFNSPGAKGFGVKRAALAIPDSVMLLVAPACCGRNTALLNEIGYSERFFYLLLDDTDIVTGRHLNKIATAAAEIKEELNYTPSSLMICITCVDALLGTDMDRVCKKCFEKTGIPTVPAYMYALTRENKLPPMAGVRKSVYSLLKPQKRISTSCNILGYFSPLYDNCEIYPLLKSIGITKVGEIARCKTFEEYRSLSQANFNLVLNREARHAAQYMQENLGIPFIELTRVYSPQKIHKQYQLLGQALASPIDDGKYYEATLKKTEYFKKSHPSLTFAVGEWLNGDGFEISLTLLEMGYSVKEIYATVGDGNENIIKHIAKISPQTRVYSNLSPTMLSYRSEGDIDIALGADAAYYHSTKALEFNSETQPFGYQGINMLLDSLSEVLE